MGLLKSKEEKEQIKDAKEKAFLEKYGLIDLTGKDAESVHAIANELIGAKTMEMGAKLGLGVKAEDLLKVEYLRAIYEQNWIIIRQLNKLNQK